MVLIIGEGKFGAEGVEPTIIPMDQLDISKAIVYNSPADIASWPITGDITQIVMTGGIGIRISSPVLTRWPDYTPPGWNGPLQFTVWLVIKLNDQLYTSGIVQMWKERQDQDPRSIPPILTDYNRNYCYDSRWGQMMNYVPKVSDVMGFFLSAGDARGNKGVTSVRERTAVMALSLPLNDSGVFNNGSSPIPIPIPPSPMPPSPMPNPKNPGYQDDQMIRFAKEAVKLTNDLGMISVHTGRFCYDATVGPDNINPMGYDSSFTKHVAELKRDLGIP